MAGGRHTALGVILRISHVATKQGIIGKQMDRQAVELAKGSEKCQNRTCRRRYKNITFDSGLMFR